MGQRNKTVKVPAIKGKKACPIPPKLLKSPIEDIPFSQGLFSPSIQLFFNLGKWGMILLALSFPSLMIVYVFHVFAAEANPWLDYIFRFPPGPLTFCFTISIWLIAFSIMLTGFTFYGYWRYTRSKIGLATSISFFISPWWIVAADLLNNTGLVLLYNVPVGPETGWNYPQGPFYLPFLFLVIMGITFLIITMILWVSATIRIPKHPNYRIVAFATTILCSLAAFFLLLNLLKWIIMLITPYQYYMDIPILLIIPGASEFLFMGPGIFLGPGIFIMPALIINLIFFRKIFEENFVTYPAPKPLKKDAHQLWLYTIFLIFANFILFTKFFELIMTCFAMSSHIWWLTRYIPILFFLTPIPFILVAINWYKLKTNPDLNFLAFSYIIMGIEMIFLGYSFSIFIARQQPGPHPANLYFHQFIITGLILLITSIIMPIYLLLSKSNTSDDSTKIT